MGHWHYITPDSFLVDLFKYTIDSAQQQAGWRQQQSVCVCVRYRQVSLQHECINFYVNSQCVQLSLGWHVCVAMSA